MGHGGVVELLLVAAEGEQAAVALGGVIDVNEADADGRTPLSMAAYKGHGDVVKDLLGAGADVNKANMDGDDY